MRTDYRLWPYGIYLSPAFIYFHDRLYQPIVFAPWIDYYLPDRIITVASPLVPIAPDTRIKFETQLWLYNDGTSPTHDRQTRAKLKNLMDSIPTLKAEIARRKAVRA
ncbi:MAG TPA: hypothetical protein VKR55_04665 [Bradyrhizobium sp.]|uniref:hypothetical protein n=1 Tax=Bradyrhizobium sp. TaxID=376 RepID=UPI002D15D9B4|nr:hypothetical protein [Bradyrhizobium sp.]HLZ01429.1 hypothetical protein [Bradyrhizobium sp.]